MMENSNLKRKRSFAGVLLLLLFVAIAGVVYVFQTDLKQIFPGTYPGVVPPIQAKFSFLKDRIKIQLSREPSSDRIVVFAYDEADRQVAILKPIYDRVVKIMPGDLADFRVDFTKGKNPGFEVFKKANNLMEEVNFFDLMLAAKAGNLKFGVQECLYPACSMCVSACPVIANGVITMPRLEDGRIHPLIHHGGCPRSGKCFTLCKMGVIYKTDLRLSVKPDFLDKGNEDWSYFDKAKGDEN
ncbi:NADH-quinone oxidoreductase subunit I [Desulfobacula phenolica]|uniref:4Fe-4S ferredoxin-type domain-containing protein n=1 Tax=Desulfobacula phenolica TaxID=90732 RepID=A0A1H2DMZ8_9BACT|nr:hypothetical protein [Desulfobacula phenolica]SDT84265.1 hypothetical protein SAMN04487931_101181 [Desulfobacula phenolica]